MAPAGWSCHDRRRIHLGQPRWSVARPKSLARANSPWSTTFTLVNHGLLPDRPMEEKAAAVAVANRESVTRGAYESKRAYESCSTRIAPFARAASRSVQPVPETMHQPIAFFMRWTASSAARRLGNVHERRPGST